MMALSMEIKIFDPKEDEKKPIGFKFENSHGGSIKCHYCVGGSELAPIAKVRPCWGAHHDNYILICEDCTRKILKEFQEGDCG